MGRPALIAVFCVPAVLCALWTVAAGKDVNWDLLNYHYYLPYEWLNGRLEQDYFAASGQSYLNPVGYLPFYFMLSAGWHSVLASAALAAVHGVNLALLYLIGWKLFAHQPPPCAIGCHARQRDGRCHGDLLGHRRHLVSRPAACRADARRPASPARRAGAACRDAFRAGVCPQILQCHLRARRAAAGAHPARKCRVRHWRRASPSPCSPVRVLALLREFGNPVFPLLNAWFESPHALPVNLVSDRFTPRGF